MIKMLKSLIESADLAIYSYVKPGAIHRYSTRFRDLHPYIRLLTSSLEVYYEAASLSDEVSKGKRTLSDIGIGNLVRKALQGSRRYGEITEMPEYHLIMIPSIISATYTLKSQGYMDIGLYQKVMKSLLMYSTPQDSLNIYQAFRTFPTELGRALGVAGVTQGLIMTESLTLSDLLEETSRFSALSKYILGKIISVSEVTSKFSSTYLETGDLNSAAVSSYALLLEVFDGLRINPIIKDRKNFLDLLKLDNKLVREGAIKNFLIPPLNEAVFVGILKFENPKP